MTTAEAHGLAGLSDLPRDVVTTIFLLVPVPDRLRCREVCPSWRAFLAAPQLWRVLDLSETVLEARRGGDGGAPATIFQDDERQTLFFRAVLLAAVAAARGGVQAIDISGAPLWFSPRLGYELKEELVRPNAASLRVLRLGGVGAFFDPGTVAEMLSAAPGLAELAVDAVAAPPTFQRWTDLLSAPQQPPTPSACAT